MINDPTRMCRKEPLGLHVALSLMHPANLEGADWNVFRMPGRLPGHRRVGEPAGR